MRHYGALKKAPNTVLILNLAAGINDEMLTLAIRTKNKGGVARGTPLVLNYGLEFDHDVALTNATMDMTEPNMKRFKSLLASYFEKLGPRAADTAADVVMVEDVEPPGEDVGKSTLAAEKGTENTETETKKKKVDEKMEDKKAAKKDSSSGVSSRR